MEPVQPALLLAPQATAAEHPYSDYRHDGAPAEIRDEVDLLLFIRRRRDAKRTPELAAAMRRAIEDAGRHARYLAEGRAPT